MLVVEIECILNVMGVTTSLHINIHLLAAISHVFVANVSSDDSDFAWKSIHRSKMDWFKHISSITIKWRMQRAHFHNSFQHIWNLNFEHPKIQSAICNNHNFIHSHSQSKRMRKNFNESPRSINLFYRFISLEHTSLYK